MQYIEILARALFNDFVNPKSAYDDYRLAAAKKKEMENAGEKLVGLYGRGAGADIDNYYHALLQCLLAQKGKESQMNGLAMGFLKEHLYDRYKKSSSINGNMSREDFNADVKKDLKNNEFGSIIGEHNKAKSCYDLLDFLRTQRMRDANIR